MELHVNCCVGPAVGRLRCDKPRRWRERSSARGTGKEREMPATKRATRRFDPQSTDWIGLRLAVLSNRYVGSLYPEIVRSQELQRDDVAVLICLSITDATTAQDIVRYTGRPKNSISRSVAGLEKRGLLSRTAHPQAGRAPSLAFTAPARTA